MIFGIFGMSKYHKSKKYILARERDKAFLIFGYDI